MSDLPWVRFFPSDWLGGTRGMSAAETGIYITLIATMYERGEPVPEDHARLARLCGASNAVFKAALETLVADGKIQRLEAGLWNERVTKENAVRSEKSDAARRAGLASAKAKRDEKPVLPLGNLESRPETDDVVDQAKDKENQGDVSTGVQRAFNGASTNQKPESRDQKEREEDSLDLPFEAPPDPEPAIPKESGRAARTGPARPSGEFEVWYEAYPRHVGRGQAEKAYAAARKKASAETLLAAVRRAAGGYRTTDPKFIPHPATWLNGERWLDGQAAPASAVPEVVAEARAYGWPVTREGPYWRIGAALYDDAGEQIGN